MFVALLIPKQTNVLFWFSATAVLSEDCRFVELCEELFVCRVQHSLVVISGAELYNRTNRTYLRGDICASETEAFLSCDVHSRVRANVRTEKFLCHCASSCLLVITQGFSQSGKDQLCSDTTGRVGLLL